MDVCQLPTPVEAEAGDTQPGDTRPAPALTCVVTWLSDLLALGKGGLTVRINLSMPWNSCSLRQARQPASVGPPWQMEAGGRGLPPQDPRAANTLACRTLGPMFPLWAKMSLRLDHASPGCRLAQEAEQARQAAGSSARRQPTQVQGSDSIASLHAG